MIKMLKGLDKFTYVKGYEQNMEDKAITDEDKANLYKILSSAHYMLEKIQNLPKEFQREYIDALKEIELGDNPKLTSIGSQRRNTIRVNPRDCNEYEAATVLIHELTHYILSKHTKMASIEQEVVCFYMEYKLHESMKKDKDYFKNTYGSSIINNYYIDHIDRIKREEPNVSEKELAIEAFIRYKYMAYNGRAGYEKRDPDEMRNADYTDLYGIFKDKEKEI